MKILSQDFSYKNYAETGEIKDIAKLYLKFFTAISLQTKVDDLKKVYNNKYISVKFCSPVSKSKCDALFLDFSSICFVLS